MAKILETDRRLHPCQNCEDRPATVNFADQGTVMAIRGYSVWWCELCVLKAQIANAEQVMELLPEWRARLAELEK